MNSLHRVSALFDRPEHAAEAAEGRDVRDVPRLLVYDFQQDDPRRCTAAKLLRFRLVRSLRRLRAIPREALVLNPAAEEVLIPSDRLYARWGVVALDCSWRRGSTIFQQSFRGHGRRLPALVAANPTNYGHRHILSTVEALAAASYILGYPQVATRLLNLFKWGPTFLTLNADPLEAYSTASDAATIVRREREFFPAADSGAEPPHRPYPR